MKVVILCGGRGTRMGNLTNSLPKPLIKVGGRPILWHIMKIYSYFGFNDFILCLGYKGDMIKEYFEKFDNWVITFADTGLDTNTGGRIKRVEKHITEDRFFATYADGVADIDLNSLLRFYENKKTIATITVTKIPSPFGMVMMDRNNLVSKFEEKPLLKHWINAGFFVFSREIFDYIGPNDILESEVFKRLVQDKNLSAFRLRGFWRCMDTYKDCIRLNELWNSGEAEWAIWKKQSYGQ